jgi:hypothetical protein
MSRLPAALCADAEYMKMRLQRMALGDVRISGVSIAALKQICAAQLPIFGINRTRTDDGRSFDR